MTKKEPISSRAVAGTVWCCSSTGKQMEGQEEPLHCFVTSNAQKMDLCTVNKF